MEGGDTQGPGEVARGRLQHQLLGWHQPRPDADPAAVARLRDQLESGLARIEGQLDAAVAASGRGQLLVTKSRLDRLACDGWALDPAPYEHTSANVRGTLTHKALERELDGAADEPAEEVVARAWRELATRSPGDPASISRWLNTCPMEDADRLRREVAVLLERFREVWPTLPQDRLRLRTERRFDVRLAGGRVRLQGTPDLVVDSTVRDDRARTLVVDFKTGLPRAEHDRHELRFYALLVALHTGRLPFRWATFYVTEGRPEHEDLRVASLTATVRRILDAVRQAGRLVEVRAARQPPRLQGGLWCRSCLRVEDCDEADRARRAHAADHAGP